MPHWTKSCPQSLAVAVALSLVLWSGAVRAQSRDDDVEGPTGNHLIVGLGTEYGPTYPGSDKYRTLPLPAIDVKWGRLFANLENGIGVDIVDTDLVTVGASVTFMPGYAAKDAPKGVGKLPLGAGARAFVNLEAHGAVATLGVTKGLSGGNGGLIGDASLSYPIVVASRLTLIPTVRATWADQTYNNRHFGVSTAQSLASGLRQFRPGGDIDDVSALLSVNYRLTERLRLGVTGGVTTLLGKTQDSPIVFHKTQPLAFMSLTYSFGL